MREAVAERGGMGGWEERRVEVGDSLQCHWWLWAVPVHCGHVGRGLGATWKAEPLPPPIIAFDFVYKVPPPHLTTTVPPPGLPPPLPSLLPSYPVPSTNCPDRFGGFFLYGN